LSFNRWRFSYRIGGIGQFVPKIPLTTIAMAKNTGQHYTKAKVKVSESEPKGLAVAAGRNIHGLSPNATYFYTGDGTDEKPAEKPSN
jgi:hypothetical protein